MTIRRVALLVTVLMPMAASGAWAQAQTGTGGGPSSTVTAPNTSSVGRTKPPGAAAAAGGTTAEDRSTRTPEQKQDDKIQRGICIGCGAK